MALHYIDNLDARSRKSLPQATPRNTLAIASLIAFGPYLDSSSIHSEKFQQASDSKQATDGKLL